MPFEIGLVYVTGTAPSSAMDAIASALMDKHLCEFASSSAPKCTTDAVVVRVDAPSPPSSCTASRTTTPQEYHLRYIWDPSLGSSVEEFIDLFLWYKNVFRCNNNFVSTRGSVRPTSFLGAIKEGLASDGGLFMPKDIPSMPLSQLRYYCTTNSLSYLEGAEFILQKLVDSTISPRQLNGFMKKAYHRDRWSNLDNICPVRPLLERQQRAGERWTRNVSVLELYHGPTAAFKDFALQLFPHYFHLAGVLSGSSSDPARQQAENEKPSLRLQIAPKTSSSTSSVSDGDRQKKDTSKEAPRSRNGSPETASLVLPSSLTSPFVKSRPYQQFMHQQAVARQQAKNSRYLILAATSGDTGVAAISGFQNLGSSAIKVAVLYPLHGVSPVQQLQMQSMDDGHQIRVLGVKSDFDFCQSTVKDIFNDLAVKDKLAVMKPYGYFLSSANSINWGRLIPQVAYYFWCYRQLFQINKQRKEGLLEESAILTSMVPTNFTFGYPIDVVVPCGNFGNILAGFIAKLMGLPIRTLVVASNENDVLFEFIQTGRYTIASRSLSTTASPSIDILVASNVERFLFLLSGGDFALVSSLMHQLATKKSFTLPDHLREHMQQTFWAERCTEEECGKAIRGVFEASRGHRLLDTHTGVAVAVSQKYREAMIVKEELRNHVLSRSDKEGRRGVRRGASHLKERKERKENSTATPTFFGKNRSNNSLEDQQESVTKAAFWHHVSVGSVLEIPLVVASTAHWSKFPDAVYNAVRGRPLREPNQNASPEPAGRAESLGGGGAATSISARASAEEEKEITSISSFHRGNASYRVTDSTSSSTSSSSTSSSSTSKDGTHPVSIATTTAGNKNQKVKDTISHILFCYLQVERLALSHQYHVPTPHSALCHMLNRLYKPQAVPAIQAAEGHGNERPTTTVVGLSSTAGELHSREVKPIKDMITGEVINFCAQPPLDLANTTKSFLFPSSRL